MKQAIIFDLDGTIVDSLASIGNCANGCLIRAGFAPHPLEAYKIFVGDGQYELIKRALRAAGDEELSHYEAVMADYVEHFKEECFLGCVPYEGVPEALKTLKAQGIKLAVLSNKAHVNTLRVIEEVYGRGFFDVTLGQRDHVAKKPDPAAVYEILELLSLKKEEVVYTGDTGVDMKTGKAAGLFTIGVTWGFRTREELASTGADAIIDDPMDWVHLVEN